MRPPLPESVARPGHRRPRRPGSYCPRRRRRAGRRPRRGRGRRRGRGALQRIDLGAVARVEDADRRRPRGRSAIRPRRRRARRSDRAVDPAISTSSAAVGDVPDADGRAVNGGELRTVSLLAAGPDAAVKRAGGATGNCQSLARPSEPADTRRALSGRYARPRTLSAGDRIAPSATPSAGSRAGSRRVCRPRRPGRCPVARRGRGPPRRGPRASGRPRRSPVLRA